jgi:predicted RNase H-like nuclease (RuvC/YqgF family)
MSKELQAIDTFIEQQQVQISALMQTITILETKIKVLEAENDKLKDINSKELDKENNIIVRRGLRDRISRNLQPTNSERKTVDLPSEKTVIRGFSLKEIVNKGNDDVIND